jgi:hypothetical protein
MEYLGYKRRLPTEMPRFFVDEMNNTIGYPSEIVEKDGYFRKLKEQ